MREWGAGKSVQEMAGEPRVGDEEGGEEGESRDGLQRVERAGGKKLHGCVKVPEARQVGVRRRRKQGGRGCAPLSLDKGLSRTPCIGPTIGATTSLEAKEYGERKRGAAARGVEGECGYGKGGSV